MRFPSATKNSISRKTRKHQIDDELTTDPSANPDTNQDLVGFSRKRQLGNRRLISLSDTGEEIPQDLGSIDLTTISQSFGQGQIPQYSQQERQKNQAVPSALTNPPNWSGDQRIAAHCGIESMDYYQSSIQNFDPFVVPDPPISVQEAIGIRNEQMLFGYFDDNPHLQYKYLTYDHQPEQDDQQQGREEEQQIPAYTYPMYQQQHAAVEEHVIKSDTIDNHPVCNVHPSDMHLDPPEFGVNFGEVCAEKPQYGLCIPQSASVNLKLQRKQVQQRAASKENQKTSKSRKLSNTPKVFGFENLFQSTIEGTGMKDSGNGPIVKTDNRVRITDTSCREQKKRRVDQ